MTGKHPAGLRWEREDKKMANVDRITCDGEIVEIAGYFNCRGTVLTRGDYGDSIRRAFVGVDGYVYVWDTDYGWMLQGRDSRILRNGLGAE